MYGLQRFLAQFGGFFLFLLLEGICMYLIVRFNENQGRIYASSANLLSGRVLSIYGNAAAYFGLRRQVGQLNERIAELEGESWRSYYYDHSDRDTATALVDSNSLRPMYAYIAAEVFNNSISGEKNMLTINRGRKHGVREGMGVITTDGVVGVVRHVTEHFASVMSVLHKQVHVSASIRSKGYFGSLGWQGSDSRYMFLRDVPKHNLVYPGDTVETSGYSSILPRGILIGRVESCVVPAGESNYEIKVKLKVDMGRLRRVYVVQNLFQSEFEELERERSNE